MFCGLSRNNTENIDAVFGEENQFCIVYFNLNKMWVLFKVQVHFFGGDKTDSWGKLSFQKYLSPSQLKINLVIFFLVGGLLLGKFKNPF